MEPIRGTDVSLAVTLSALKAAETRNNLDMATEKLALDSQKMVGSELVKMIENLGVNIDTYA